MFCYARYNLLFGLKLFLFLACFGVFLLGCGGGENPVVPEEVIQEEEPDQETTNNTDGEADQTIEREEETPLVVSSNEPIDQIAVGTQHVCKLIDNQVTCWGDNYFGQTDVIEREDYQTIVAGYYHTCGLTFAGEVYCWGDDRFRQLEVDPTVSYTSISAGAFHTCALDLLGQIDCWGDNRGNQLAPQLFRTLYTGLGLGNQHSCGLQEDGRIDCWGSDFFSQSETPEGLGYLQVAGGDAHTCALDAEGLVLCWGKNDFGQSEVPSGLGPVKKIFLGPQNTCALDFENQVTCWGINDKNQLMVPVGQYTDLGISQNFGCGITLESAVVCWGDGQPNPDGLRFKQVASDRHHNCAITDQDYLVCWGDNNASQITIPREYRGIRFSQLTAGADHNCAITTEDRRLVCWGNDEDGRLEVPVIEEGKGTYFEQVDAGYNRTCAITDTGHLYCWGLDSIIPAEYSELTFTDISLGIGHTCAIKIGGQVVCWGEPYSGRTEVPPEYEEVVFSQIAAGLFTNCGILDQNKRIVCWGYDFEGGVLISAPLVNNFSNLEFRTVEISSYYTCGLTFGGEAYCWANSVGLAALEQPMNPAGMLFDSIAVGYEHFCGVSTEGALKCTGRARINDSNPALGLGSYASQAFKQIEFKENHACGILFEDNRVVCWGENYSGQTDVPASLSRSEVTRLVVGRYHNCAVLADIPLGSTTNLFCWGYDREGRLTIPLDYQEATFFDVSVSEYHTCGVFLRPDQTIPEIDCWGDWYESEYYDVPESLLTRITAADIGQIKIFGSYDHHCAMLRDQVPTCWGRSGTDLELITPFEESADGGTHFFEFASIDIGTSYACGILAENNRLECWGNNAFDKSQGYLPDYENHEFLDVDAGNFHTCGILAESNRLVCWGNDTFGALYPPVDYLSQNRFIQVSVGRGFTCGILKESRRVLCWGERDGRLLEAPQLY